YDIADSADCVPLQSQGIYIKYMDSSHREWVSFIEMASVHYCPGNLDNFAVTFKNIINENYNDSLQDMSKFPSVFVRGAFNCDLYSPDSLGGNDSLKIENASFGGKFIEYSSF